jgi:ribose transport system substrate-binding protein
MKEIVKLVKDTDVLVPVDIVYSPSMIGTAMEVTALRFATNVAIDGTYILNSPLVTPANAAQWYFPNSPF